MPHSSKKTSATASRLPMHDFDIGSMRCSVTQAVTLLRLLANEDRLLLLCQLTQGEACVSDLETTLDICQPTLSQQLGILRNDGLVTTRREGKRIYYHVADGPALAILQTLYGLYCNARTG